MIETKVIQVANDPETINRVNEIWGRFGWTVMSIQVTNTQNTKTYTKDLLDYYSGFNTVETTTINYATITYQRDTKMEKYEALCSAEREFLTCMNELNQTQFAEDSGIGDSLVRGGKILCVIIGLGQMLYFNTASLICGLCTAVLGPILISSIYKNTKGKKIAEEYEKIEEKRSALIDTLDRIVEQARQL